MSLDYEIDMGGIEGNYTVRKDNRYTFTTMLCSKSVSGRVQTTWTDVDRILGNFDPPPAM